MKVFLLFSLLVSYQLLACDQHIHPKRPILMSEEMEGFWNLQSHEYQLETIKLVERLLNHYISHSQLSMEVNLSVFAGFMMYRLNGSFKSWPRGKDFDWVRNFLDDLIHHSHANEEAQVLLTELQHKFS